MRNFSLFSLVFFLLLLNACGDDPEGVEVSDRRSIRDFALDVDDGGETPQYYAKWSLPDDMDKMEAIYIWVALGDSTGERADFFKRETGFSKYDSSSELPSSIKVYKLETQSESATDFPERWNIPKDLVQEAIDAGLDQIYLFIWADYSSGREGGRFYTRLYLRDVFPASSVTSEHTVTQNSIEITWYRPFDQVDGLDPNKTGMIYGYNLVLSSKKTDVKTAKIERIGTVQNKAPIEGGIIPVSGTPLTSTNHEKISGSDSIKYWILLDGGTRGEQMNLPEDKIGVRITGLKSNMEYTYSVLPLDSMGNITHPQNPENRIVAEQVIVSTTDNSKPVFEPKMRVAPLADDSTVHLLEWTRALDENKENQIAKYGFIRIDSSVSGVDTLIWEREVKDLTPVSEGSSRLLDTLFFLIPGRSVELKIFAVDHSGYHSDTISSNADTNTMIEISARTKLDCPLDMIAVPGRELSQDYCMERFEHRDSEGEFATALLWQEARESCQALNVGADWTADLCSEEQWVSACEEGMKRIQGTLYYNPLTLNSHLSFECMIGSGDSLSAADVTKRSSICITGDGIRDLPGQYQEWVLGDGDVKEDSVAVIKGASYMVPQGSDIPTTLGVAQCRSQSFGSWVRPKFRLAQEGGTLRKTLYVFITDSTAFELVPEDSLNNLRVSDTLYYRGGDSVQVYSVYSPKGTKLSMDTLLYLPSRVGYLETLAGRLDYRAEGKPLPAYILGESSRKAGKAYHHRSIGFRCCAQKKSP